MSLVTLRSTQLSPSQQPRLPAAPVEYDRTYVDALTGILRQYFNQVDNLTQSLLTNTGQRFLRAPTGSFYDNTTQSTTANTATLLLLGNTDTLGTNAITVAPSATASFTGSISGTTLTVTAVSSPTTNPIYVGMAISGTGITAGTVISALQNVGGNGGVGTYTVSVSQTVASTTISGTVGQRMIFTYPGVYNLQFSVQAQNTDNAQHDINIWLRQNGLDIVGSTGYISIPARKSVGAGNEGHGIYGWNFFLEVQASDCIQMYWSTDNAAVTIQNYAAGTSPTRPSTYSVVATITFVSAPLT